MEQQVPVGAEQWAAALRLSGKLHGDEFFIIDSSGEYPVWYRLDGSVFTNYGLQVVFSPEMMLWAIQRRGWTRERLYESPPQQGES